MQLNALCNPLLCRRILTKMLLLMQLTAILLIMSCLQLSAKGFGQTITVNFKNAPLKQVFRAIERQSGYSFVYGKEQVAYAEPVNLTIANAKLEEVLNLAFKRKTLTYTISGKYIVVKQQKVAASERVALLQEKIHGRVTDETGKALEGASVIVKGAPSGTSTNANGEFEINVPDNSSRILVISFVGMEERTVNISGGAFVNITLNKKADQQQEIVVVGYGTQKKVNLSGSVVSVSSKQIENRAASDLSGILTGQIPGLTIIQNGGNPGRNVGSLNIRGIGTLNNSDPLIVVDGIPTGILTDINPEDVASVSVLKDAASASIYGVRAANGVILVTTKRGNNAKKSAVTYSHQTGYTQFISLPGKATAFELATLHNQANTNDGTPLLFSNADLQKFNDGSSPLTHANVDLIGLLFSKGLWNSDNISLSGGNEKGAYNVSLGHITEGGLLKQTGLQKYTVRTNFDIKISKKITAGLNLAGTINEIKDPAAGLNWITHIAFREWANDAVQFPDGRWSNPAWSGREHNAVAYSSGEMGKSRTHDVRILATGFAEYEIIKSLKLKGIVSVLQDFNKTDAVILGVDLYRIDPSTGVIAGSPSSTTVNLQKGSPMVDQVSRDYFNNNEKNYQLLLTYDKERGKHSVTGLAGYEQREKTSEFSNLYRRKLISDQLDQINAADLTQDYAAGNTIASRLQSVFGRINYGFDERYLLEANLRYDGSTRFAKQYRFDYFPSMSAAWRISKENFLNIPIVSELKLRASWGKLGNQEVGDYGYIQTYILNGSYFFNGQEFAAITEGALSNPTLTWEKTEAKNIGLDLELFNNKLAITGDYFVKNTKDILYYLPQPSILGTTGLLSNAASVKNTGFEINAAYRDHAGKMNYYVRGNISKIKNEITDLAGTDRPGFSVGDPIQNYFGYRAAGLFQSADEVSKSPDQSALGNVPKAGDIKYADLNNDDKINADDRTNLGKRFPGINYGFSLGADYKSFDISMLWQGVADSKIMGSGRFIQPFWFGSSPLNYQLDSWTPDNKHARFPEVSFTNSANYLPSSFWIQSGAYLKLRNLQIGYTLSASVINKIGLSRARLYISAENLLSISSFDYGFDPEDVSYEGDPVSVFNANGPANYPTTKRLLAGLTVTF